jgi:hypothetical protein
METSNLHRSPLRCKEREHLQPLGLLNKRGRRLAGRQARCILSVVSAMPAFYKIDKQRKLVMSKGTGVLTMTEALAHQRKLLKDPDFDPSYSQLLDVTHVTDVDLSTEDIRRLAVTKVFSADSRRAILVNNDLQFGLSRMFEVFRENMGETGIRVFRNLDDALDWVLCNNDRSRLACCNQRCRVTGSSRFID